MFLVILICLVRRLLERPLLVFDLRIRAKISVSEHQENDARNGYVVVLKCVSGIVHQCEAL